MTKHNAAHRLVALAISTQLSGCFFVFIPGSLINAAVGNPSYCVGEGSGWVGAKFRLPDGRVMEVTRVAGPSPYVCRAQPPSMQTGVDAKEVAQ